jgi:hypothetical protein
LAELRKVCAHIDSSAYRAAIRLLGPTASFEDRVRVDRENPGVKCRNVSRFRVEMYADDPDDDSQVHLCEEHVGEWEEDEHTAIFDLDRFRPTCDPVTRRRNVP